MLTMLQQAENSLTWWDRLLEIGPDYGYYPNASKTWLIVKEHKHSEAVPVFEGTEIVITTVGKRHLGAAIGTRSFIEKYAEHKIAAWVHEVETISSLATIQPHAAYAAFTRGLGNKWTFLARTSPDTNKLFELLEEKIRTTFLPSLTGQDTCNGYVRDLLALPVRLGGLGIVNPSKRATLHHNAFEKITTPLSVSSLCSHRSTRCRSKPNRAKKSAQSQRRQSEKLKASEISENLPATLQKSMKISTEKGASIWLSTLPIQEHGFALHKGAFRDALCLRYGWQPKHLPSHCACGRKFTVDHALNCHRGGFPSIRHNKIRDITAHLLTEVCHGVGTEPHLQPVTDERLFHRTANREDEARLDIVTEDFWGRDRQRTYFDVRVFNPLSRSYQNSSIAQSYRKNEQEKRRQYDERIREIEHGSFSPLIFTTSDSVGPTATVVYNE